MEIQFAGRSSFGARQFRLTAVIGCLACAVFLAIFALGWIPGVTNQMGMTGEFIIFGFVFFLVGCAVWAWFLFAPIVRDTANRVDASSSDIRISYPAAPELVVRWSDPSLTLSVIQYSTGPGVPLNFLVKAGNRRAFASIRPDSLPELSQMAQANGRTMAAQVRGKPPRTWTVWTLADIKSESPTLRSS